MRTLKMLYLLANQHPRFLAASRWKAVSISSPLWVEMEEAAVHIDAVRFVGKVEDSGPWST